MNILRDAAHLQTQLRLYDGLVETRHTLLRLRPQLRQNWIALAVAYHLSGNLAEAKSVLEQYERIVKVCVMGERYAKCRVVIDRVSRNRCRMYRTTTLRCPRSSYTMCMSSKTWVNILKRLHSWTPVRKREQSLTASQSWSSEVSWANTSGK